MKEMTGKELETLVEAGKTVVCDFWAPRCMPCRMLAPILETLSAEFGDRATFAKINVDEDGDLAASLGIYAIPDIVIFEGGAVKTHSVGYASEEELRAFFSENL